MVNCVVGQILIHVTCVTTPSTGLHYRTSSPLSACLVSEWGMISGRFLSGAWICMQTQLCCICFLFSVKHAWLCALSLEQWLPVFSARNKRNGRGVKQVTNRAAQSGIFKSNYLLHLENGKAFQSMLSSQVPFFKLFNPWFSCERSCSLFLLRDIPSISCRPLRKLTHPRKECCVHLVLPGCLLAMPKNVKI